MLSPRKMYIVAVVPFVQHNMGRNQKTYHEPLQPDDYAA